jgi:hypothetical protein
MGTPIDIRELLSRRADLSTFLVHLTRDTEDGRTAKSNLKRILKRHVLLARRPFGPAGDSSPELSKRDLATQRCVSFSETPLEHIHCLTCEIPGRGVRLSNYGLAFTKMAARKRGVNPVWYVDITPGHDWLMKPINEMIRAEAKRGRFRESNLAQVCPFIEPMGSGRRRGGWGYRKEFWWEREWRHRGDFSFGYYDIAFGLAPEDDVEAFETRVRTLSRRRVRFLDPNWGPEKMIAHLAGCVGALTPFDPL